MHTSDPLAIRLSRILESGVPKEDAWKAMVVEILTEAGMIAPEHLEPSPADAKKESVQLSVSEAKLLKVIRIEPSEQERVKALLKIARHEAAAARQDVPSESSVIRQAISLGLDELEKQRSRR